MTTKAEQRHLAAVAGLGCCLCKLLELGESPAEIHHLRTRPDGQKYGASQRASNFETIPLCPAHHRLGGAGVAFHAGERTWEAKFWPELELLGFVKSWLQIVAAS